jgi:hypothetical protein
MYFPAVLSSKDVKVVRSVVWPHWEKGTCMVMRDNFKDESTVNEILDFILKTTPDKGLVQEIKITVTRG